MPNWKKVVVSGSNAALNQITASSALLTTIDGITSLTAGGNLDIGSHAFRAQTLQGDGSSGGLILGDGGSDSIRLVNNTQQTLAITVGDDDGDEYATIGSSGLDINYGTLNIPSDLRHLGDNNTKLSFTTDKITLTAGGVNFITMTEATSDTLVFGDVQTTFSGNITASGAISASGTVQGLTGSFHALVGDTSQDTSLEVDGHITASGNISSSGYVYSKNSQYWSTNGRVTVGNNTTNYYGPNPQGTNYYYWSRDLGTSSTTITNKTQTLNSGWKLPYKAVLTGYHLNIQGRSTTDNISFTLVYSDGMWDGDVTSTSQTLVEAEGAQTVTIPTQNNFYELDRRDQFAIPVSAMTMLYPRFKKTAATGGTSYDFQLAVEYYVVQ